MTHVFEEELARPLLDVAGQDGGVIDDGDADSVGHERSDANDSTGTSRSAGDGVPDQLDPLSDAGVGAKNDANAVEEPIATWRAHNKRYVVVAMLWLGFFNLYAMRVNLSEASLPMQV